MRDDRGLQGDHRFTGRKRGADPRGHLNQGRRHGTIVSPPDRARSVAPLADHVAQRLARRVPGQLAPNGITTISTWPAEGGSSSPPVQTSAVIGPGRPPMVRTQPRSGSHTVIVAVVMTATLLRPYLAAAR
ncbi:MAG: hypothetical protein ACRDPD_21900 [Streptosporangiaceae bacterium]